MYVLMVFCENRPDYGAYRFFFNSIHDVSDIFNQQFEVGYMFVCYILKTMGFSFEVAMAVITFVGFILLGRVILKYSPYPAMVLALYYISPFFPLSIIQIRSFVASVIVVNAIMDFFYREKKEKSTLIYIITVIFASTFHSSMLFCLTFVFVGKLKKIKNYVMISLVSCFVMLFADDIISFFPFVSESKYVYIDNTVRSFGMQTVGIVVTIFFEFLVIFYLKKKVLYGNYKSSTVDLITNISKIKLLQLPIIVLILIYAFHFYRIILGVLLVDYIGFSVTFLEMKNKKNSAGEYWFLIFAFSILGVLFSAINSLSTWNGIFINNRFFKWIW